VRCETPEFTCLCPLTGQPDVAIAPRRMTVVTDWLVRGGIHTVVEAPHP
jgi:NADPH-dependent 7-cyano-7-deazaguanine reductase QueF